MAGSIQTIDIEVYENVALYGGRQKISLRGGEEGQDTDNETDGGKTKNKVGTRQKMLKSALSSQMYQPPSSGQVGGGGMI